MSNFIPVACFRLSDKAQKVFNSIPLNLGWSIFVDQDTEELEAFPDQGNGRMVLGTLEDNGLRQEWIETPMSAEECYNHGVAQGEWHIL